MLPTHIAMIMDGNGRWAKARGLPRTAGHHQGAEAAREMLKAAIRAGVPYLTLYTFSSENWQRPESEVHELMQLLKHYVTNEIKTLHKENIRLRVIGDRTQLASDIQHDIEKAEALTANNTALTLILALSYGSRQELVRAIQKIGQEKERGANIGWDEATISEYLDTGGIPDPDLLIRTGGEKRLSNFLLWQCAYTELWFTDILWPDFSADDFQKALQDYAQRERRYGTAPMV